MITIIPTHATIGLCLLCLLWVMQYLTNKFRAGKREFGNHNNTKDKKSDILRKKSNLTSRSTHIPKQAHSNQHPSPMLNESSLFVEHPSRDVEILGPKGPQEITFLVTTPPSKIIPVLHTGTKYRSIKRQLAFNLQNMTWELRKPKEMAKPKEEDLENTSLTNASVSSLVSSRPYGESIATANSNNLSDIVWEKAESSHIFPIESLLNVSALKPEKCATVELIFEKKNSLTPLSSTSDMFLSNMVTLENWKAHDADAISLQRWREGSVYARNQDDCANNQDDGSLVSIIEEDDIDDASSSMGMLGSVATLSGHTGRTFNDIGRSNGRKKKKAKVAPSPKRKKSRVKQVTKEYTFNTEFDAGAFQTLFLAMRIVGAEVFNLYSALEVVHKFSEAHDGSGYGGSKVGGGVAFNDIHRCLGDCPFVSKRIAIICQKIDGKSSDKPTVAAQVKKDHISHDSIASLSSSSVINDDPGEDASPKQGQATRYDSKRLVLGYVDFFRLFIPTILHGTPYASPVAASNADLLDTDLDGIENHQTRIYRLARIRMRVARAAVRVRSYCMAMNIVNQGWKIDTSSITNYYPSQRRLAFDTEVSNQEHDCISENEFYDPMTAQEPHQGYALVGFKTIRLPSGGAREEVSPPIDPVEFLASLRSIMNKNPLLDFLVLCIHHKKKEVLSILLFVKWLPREVDEAFDNANDLLKRKADQSPNEILQLSLAYTSNSYSILPSIFGRQSAQHAHKKHFQVCSLSNSIEYFGGSLRSHTSLPSNYQGFVVNVEKLPGHLRRILNGLVPTKDNSFQIVDLNFQLRDNARSLAAARIVCLNPSSILPFSEVASKGDIFSSKHSAIYNAGGIDDIIESENKESLDTLKDIMSCITVPCNRNTIQSKQDLCDVQVLQLITSDDIKRHFIAADKDVKEAAIRITKCAAFRGLTFPIATRLCHIELCSGQFFQQGRDLEGNPVFYFRNFCPGIWRKDVDASILAVLHRLQNAFTKLSKVNLNFKCTLVVLTGKPTESKMDSKAAERSSSDRLDDSDESQDTELEKEVDTSKAALHIHTNFKFVQRLIEIITQNYPERLNCALLVPSGGWEKLLGTHGLRRYIQSSKIRSKVKMLDDEKDLKKFISQDELIHIVGGHARMVSFDGDY